MSIRHPRKSPASWSETRGNLYEAEADGEIVEYKDKVVVSRCQLLNSENEKEMFKKGEVVTAPDRITSTTEKNGRCLNCKNLMDLADGLHKSMMNLGKVWSRRHVHVAKHARLEALKECLDLVTLHGAMATEKIQKLIREYALEEEDVSGT